MFSVAIRYLKKKRNIQFSSGYWLNFERIKSSEFEETTPLKDNLVLVFYTENVFIAESGGNIHCASRFESFKH